MFFKKKEEKELTIEEEVELRDITTFEKNNKNLKDLIANDYLDFAESPKYCAVGEKYAKNMYIGILPANVTFPSYLDELYTFGDIDTSLFVVPIEAEESIAELSKLRTNLEMEYVTAGGSNNRRDDMAAKVYESKRLREEVRDGFNKLYEVATVCTLYSPTMRSLDNDTAKLRQIMGRKDIGLKNAIYLQEDAYLSNKPLQNNKVNEYHTYDKRSLA